MNSPTNALSESPVAAQAVAPVAISEGRRMYWSLRRELWESRSLYIAPLVVAGLILVGFLISLGRFAAKMQGISALSPVQQQEAIQQPYDMAALLLMGATLVVAVFYCLDALHGERRDRSILFWKSLPVSDLTTVLSKAAIVVVVLPLITFAITVVTQWLLLLLNTAVLVGSGQNAGLLWSHLSLGQAGLFWHLLAIHGFWYAPFYAWLLLVSAWARRATFLWAALPLVGIGVIEKIAFNTSHFAATLGNRFIGSAEGGSSTEGGTSMSAMLQVHPGHLVMSPGLWIGLAVTAALLAAAVRVRRYQGPI